MNQSIHPAAAVDSPEITSAMRNLTLKKAQQEISQPQTESRRKVSRFIGRVLFFILHFFLSAVVGLGIVGILMLIEKFLAPASQNASALLGLIIMWIMGAQTWFMMWRKLKQAVARKKQPREMREQSASLL